MNSFDSSVKHPAFPQPEDANITIWRYMDLHKFVWLMQHGCLYMPCVEQLDNDPLEGTTPKGELDWWARRIANADSDEQRRILEHNRNFLSSVAKDFRAHYFVSCWHINKFENRAMWPCYTSSSDAVAIRTKYATLLQCFPRYGLMGIVRYIDYATERLPSMNLLEHIMHKDVYYTYEQEVRAVVFTMGPNVDIDKNHYEREDSPNHQIHAPPVSVAQLIEAVVLHPEASRAFETKVTDICLSHGLSKPEKSRGLQRPAS